MLTRTLKSYIDTQGYSIPPSFCNHTPGGPDEETCPFCDTYLVGDDNTSVLLVDLSRWDESFLSAKENGLIAIFICNECRTHLQKEEFFDQDYEVEEAITETTQNIQHHINTGLFPQGADIHAEGRILDGSCVMCQELIDIKGYITAYKETHLPVGFSSLITGPVKICNKCSLVEDFLITNQSSTGEYPTVLESSDQITFDTCPHCHTTYTITEEERVARLERTALSEAYLCNSCLIKDFSLLNEERFMKIRCIDCDEVSLLDLSEVGVAPHIKRIKEVHKCNTCKAGKRRTNPISSKPDLFSSTQKEDMSNDNSDFIQINISGHRIVINKAMPCLLKEEGGEVYSVLITNEEKDPKDKSSDGYVIENLSTQIECTGSPETCNCFTNNNDAVVTSTLRLLEYLDKKNIKWNINEKS